MTTPTAQPKTTTAGKIECLCPYCGSFNAGVTGTCQTCGTEDTAVARSSAGKKPGSWYVLQARNPDAAGMSFETLRALTVKGAVTGRSVVRGPTTGQLWRLACKVRGLSRELGHCYACGHAVKADEGVCTACLRIQTLPANADPAPFCEHEIKPAGELRPVFEAKPAAKPARKPPREDLLTVKDLAKAFQLDFGPTSATTLNDLLPPKRTVFTPNRIKIALSAAGAVVAIALVGPIGMALAGRTRPPAPAPAAPAAVVVALTPPARTWHPSVAVVRPAVFVATASKLPDFLATVEGPTPPKVAPPAVAVADPAATAVLAATVAVPALATPDTDDPQQLWSTGLECEARGDYANAVAVYERIESLPCTLWPTDLKARLKLARSAVREVGR